MSKRDNSILELIKKVGIENVPSDGRVVLYGSRARGDSSASSDWDLLIILNKSRIEQSDYDNISYPFFENGLSIGQLFSPVLFTETEWDNHKSSYFRYNVEKDGIQIL